MITNKLDGGAIRPELSLAPGAAFRFGAWNPGGCIRVFSDMKYVVAIAIVAPGALVRQMIVQSFAKFVEGTGGCPTVATDILYSWYLKIIQICSVCQDNGELSSSSHTTLEQVGESCTLNAVGPEASRLYTNSVC